MCKIYVRQLRFAREVGKHESIGTIRCVDVVGATSLTVIRLNATRTRMETEWNRAFVLLWLHVWSVVEFS